MIETEDESMEMEDTTVYTPYISSLLSIKIQLSFSELSHLESNLEERLKQRIANKCIEHGYISPNNIHITTHSAGIVQNEYILYDVVYTCRIAHPVEGQILQAKIKTITIAGIHGEVEDKFGNIPITVFVARDHVCISSTATLDFANYKEGQIIYVKVIGSRYELNDPCVYVIAEVTNEINPKLLKQTRKRQTFTEESKNEVTETETKRSRLNEENTNQRDAMDILLDTNDLI